MKLTRIFEENAKAYLKGYRRALNEGGTAGSKTYSILQELILLAQSSKNPLLISIVSESLPHLKRGCIRDFFNIINETQDNNPRYSKTEFTYTFGLGVIEFFGADNPAKVRGPRRQILFLNEANNIPWETAQGLDIRTELFTFADWNPVGEFWAHEYWKGQPENNFIHSTYEDAKEVLPKAIVANIESNRDKDPNWWNIYGLGLPGKVEGLVHPLFKQVDVLPDGIPFYGLDYGFSSDPTVLTKHVLIGDNLYSQQVFYDYSGLTNPQIAQKMELLNISSNAHIGADPSEPKSTEEIRQKGFNIEDSVKGAGSKAFGIKKVNNYYQHWTKDSLECIKDKRNYRWIKDPQTGLFTDETTHQWSHGMDSLVSGTLILTKQGNIPIEEITKDDKVLTRKGWKSVLFSGQTGIKNVQTVKLSNGNSLTGTFDHLIWIKSKGFLPLNTLRYGDIIESCSGNVLFTMGENILGIPILLIGQIRSIIEGQEKGEILKESDIYIVKFGLTIMVKFLKIVKYTIKMVIHSTIISKILSVLIPNGTISIIQPLILIGDGNGLGIISGNIRIKPMHGIKHRKEKNIIIRLENLHGKENSPNLTFVNCVDRNILQDNQILKQENSVLTNASLKTEETQAKIIFPKFVIGVKRLLRLINIVLGNVVPVYVLSVSEPHKEEHPVYDITTEDIPEFYANGILVHNSRRYAIAAYRELKDTFVHSLSRHEFLTSSHRR